MEATSPVVKNCMALGFLARTPGARKSTLESCVDGSEGGGRLGDQARQPKPYGIARGHRRLDGVKRTFYSKHVPLGAPRPPAEALAWIE